MSEAPLELATRLRDEAADAGLKRFRDLHIRVATRKEFNGRTFGMSSSDGREIILSPDLGEQPDDIVQGIVIHELGHVADFLYPACWEEAFGRWFRYTKRHRITEWRRRDHDQVERAADGIAQAMFGAKIRYRGPDLLQSTCAGVSPRPRGLR